MLYIYTQYAYTYTYTSRRAVFRTCVLHNFIISSPLKVHLVWEALSVFCSACTKWCGNWLVFLEKSYFACVFMQFWPRIMWNLTSFGIGSSCESEWGDWHTSTGTRASKPQSILIGFPAVLEWMLCTQSTPWSIVPVCTWMTSRPRLSSPVNWPAEWFTTPSRDRRQERYYTPHPPKPMSQEYVQDVHRRVLA